MRNWNDLAKDRKLLIAEIGNNHNGDFKLAKRLIKEAADAGADGVKFQTFIPDKYVHKSLLIFSHAKGLHKTQYERLMSLKFEFAQFVELSLYAKSMGVIFLSTPFDEESAEFLDDIVPAYKIASGDITNLPLLRKIVGKNKPVFISTGMASDNEIERAVGIFPKKDIILLHCIARYPALAEEVNLLSIPYLRARFNVEVGYSDHTIGLDACKAAVSIGAVLIEKHFTLDKNQPIGDHKISMNPDDLAELVTHARKVEKMLGRYGNPIGKEIDSARMLRRSLYARTDIPKGAKIYAGMIVTLRPADGLPADGIDNLIGKTARSNIKKDMLLTEEMFA